MTGDEFRFVVYNARESSRAHHTNNLKANSKLIYQIRSDFREVLGEGVNYWEEEASDSEPPGTGVFQVTGTWDEGWTNVGSDVFRKMTNKEAGIVAQKGRDGVDLIEVLPGSPAYECGLRTGDILLSIDGKVSFPRDKVTRVLIIKYMAQKVERLRSSLHSPFSMTPAFNHLATNPITRSSPMRYLRNRSIQSHHTLSKNPRMSASTIHPSQRLTPTLAGERP